MYVQYVMLLTLSFLFYFCPEQDRMGAQQMKELLVHCLSGHEPKIKAPIQQTFIDYSLHARQWRIGWHGRKHQS